MKDLETFLGKNILKHLTPFAIVMGAAIPVFLVALEIAGNFNKQGDAQTALVIALCFVAGLYTGRYISLLWINSRSTLQNWLLLFIPMICIVAGLFVIFFIRMLYKHFEASYLLLLFTFFFLMNVAIGMFAKLIRERIRSRIENAEIKAVNSETELQLLQSQLSPHFLFNTLNNLYGLSIAEHQKLPALLLKLSELLRYAVYDAKETYVPLQDELAYLKNYMDFEKIRIGERLELTTDFDIAPGTNIKIAPMLLIVFVENAFKHSKNSQEQKIHIDITLKIWGNSILFSCINSYNMHSKEFFETSHASGLGLTNVKKRLELLYPNEHDLKIEENKNIFTVMLRINAK
ncbi:sensor histidine kinase [Ferruginibacter sp.]